MRRDRTNILRSIDWLTILLLLVLTLVGWLSVCGSSDGFTLADITDFSTRACKQLVWIAMAAVLAILLQFLDDSLYDILAYVIYGAMIGLLILTAFIAPEIKGSHSWISLGGVVSVQPAEFAKFATALALAKFMSGYGFNFRNLKDRFMVLLLIFLPVACIILERETGSALVYMSLFLMLYRMGMPGCLLYLALAAVTFFVVGLKFENVLFLEDTVSVGRFTVLSLILVSGAVMLSVLRRRIRLVWWILLPSALVLAGVASLRNLFGAVDLSHVLLGLIAVLLVLILLDALRRGRYRSLLVGLYMVGSVGFLYSTSYICNEVLEPHQQMRIKVLLGLEDDVMGAGYNVNQSKIAIGSGGLWGKGFMKGTQTKLNYVPEQDTDFIFCTIGEEQGFVGSTVVLVLYLLLILRLLHLAERQPTTFGLVYGYCVVSILLFHLMVNVGMVLGLMPVIGIPLPLFSYGGSQLWGFTVLLFIFLRIDAARGEKFR